ncbi:MAG: PfkB family carbohydrate kinase [Syntrophales bacterium]
MHRVDVLCVGASSYDLVFRVDHHPLPDEKTTAAGFIGCGGGPAANASIMVARMGLKAAFAGYLGTDLFGRLHLEELRGAGVDTDLVVRGEDPTPVSCVLVKPTGERSLVNYRAAEPLRKPSGIAAAGISPRVMLFDGHEPDLSLALLSGARASGIRSVLDAGSLNRGTALLFDQVEYPVCSERFACDFTGTASPEAALDRLSPPGRCVVVTLGGRGVLWKRDGRTGRMPAFPVRAVDTTGAGDVFHGAFAGSLAIGNSWEEMLVYASAAAALCCTRLGARTGIPAGREVDQFLAEFRDRGMPASPP